MLLNTYPTVSGMVRKDYRISDVFKRWGINYCCGGNSTLEDICRTLHLDQTAIEIEVDQATRNILLSNALAFDDWPVDFLLDYISNVHHAYVKTAGSKLQQLLLQFVDGHKKKYPHLVAVEASYNKLLVEVLADIKIEEEIIFPYLKQVSNLHKQIVSDSLGMVRMIDKPLSELSGGKSEQFEKLLTTLRTAATNYSFAEDACTNHQVIYHKLKEFDADLVHHKHLENNVLLPKKMQMEKELLLV